VPVGKNISVPAAAAINSTTFFNNQISFNRTNLIEPHSKEQQAVIVLWFPSVVLRQQLTQKNYPALSSKNICLKTDRDITPILGDIMKLSKEIRSVDLLKVLDYNDMTNSLVEAPCSAK
jgi:hypothetical protein